MESINTTYLVLLDGIVEPISNYALSLKTLEERFYSTFADVSNKSFGKTLNIGNDLIMFHLNQPSEFKRSNWIISDEYDLLLGTKSEGAINSYWGLIGIQTGNGINPGNTADVYIGYGTAGAKLTTTGYGVSVTGSLSVTNSIGIGTTNPQTKLHLQDGDLRVSSGSTFVFGTGFGIGATSVGYAYAASNPFTAVMIGGTAGRIANALIDISAKNYPDATNVLNIQTTSETYTGTIGTYKPFTPAGTVIEIGNTRASQRVGIGSTLFGKSGSLISIYAYNNDFVTNAFFGAAAGDTENGPANFVFGRRTGAFSWEETVRINTSGNLGIGTTNPTSALTVSGDGSFTGVVTATGGFISVGNTTPIQISLIGNQLTFTAVGIGSTTLTLS